MNKGIEIEYWKEYFLRLLVGVEGRVIGKERRVGERGGKRTRVGRDSEHE